METYEHFEAAADKLRKQYKIARDQLALDIEFTTRPWEEFLSPYGGFDSLTTGYSIDGIHNRLHYIIVHNYFSEGETIFRNGVLVSNIYDSVPFMNEENWARIEKEVETDVIVKVPWGSRLQMTDGTLSYSIPLMGGDSSPFTEEKFKNDPRCFRDVPLFGGPDLLTLMELNLWKMRRYFRALYLENEYPEDPRSSKIDAQLLPDLMKHIQYAPKEYPRDSYSDGMDMDHIFRNDYITIRVGYSYDESNFIDSLIDFIRDSISPILD